jgi:very-short-patch-repair endonuclease
MTRLHHKVYLVGPGPPTRKGRWLAAVLAAGEGALLARTDAAALHDIAKSRGSRIDVLIPAHRRRKLKDVRVHRCRRIHPDDISLVDSIPVTSIERTICDLASVLPYADLKRAFEEAERRHLVDHRKLGEAVERMRGMAGAAATRDLLGYDARPATETRSELEIAFLRLITDAGLPPYQRNVVVHGHEIDAYWPEADLVVELQSYTWHSDPEAFERDHAKLARLRVAGFTVHAFTYHQVTANGRWIAEAIRAILDDPGSEVERTEPA